ncbi:MAG: hypothetical protein HOV79_06015 [Hamadaea sp.]|nr:hypothetical protein [Hamadaea sp.]
MTRQPRRPPELRGKIFRGSQARALGLLTKKDLQSSAWRKLFRDVYADAALAPTHRTRAWAAARYLLPEHAALGGRSAAAFFGVNLAKETDAVEVATSKDFGPIDGLVIHRGPLPDPEVVSHGGVRLTSPVRTCWDLCRWRPVDEAVVFLDALVARGIVGRDAIGAYAEGRRPERGWRRVDRAVRLVDGAAESPQESRLRVRLVLAGFPPPISQHVLTAGGVFVARFDLAWPQWRIAVEYDGAWHAERTQLERDRARLNRVAGAGWLVLHITAARLRDDFDGFARELREAMISRGAAVSVRCRMEPS